MNFRPQFIRKAKAPEKVKWLLAKIGTTVTARTPRPHLVAFVPRADRRSVPERPQDYTRAA